MKKPKFSRSILIAGGAVPALAAAAWFWSQREAEKPAYDYVEASRGAIQVTLQQSGTVVAEHRLNVTPPIGGRVDSVEVEDGDLVKQGQTLAWISSTERAALIDAARASGEKEYEYWKGIYKPAPLLAPLDGRIISTAVVPGQAVESAQAVFVMSDRLIVEADVDETDLYQIKLGQKVDITLDGFPQARLSGKVYKIAYDSETVNNVTTYKVEILPDQTPDYVRSGLTANVFFLIAEAADAVLVPSDAVTGGRRILVATRAGAAPDAREVETGLDNGRFVEIRSGLREGEWVAKPKFTLQEAKAGFSFMPRFNRQQNKSAGPPPRP
jgi:macrolide-specific efflux system membrane fusion protein